jgi:hypothetical protein
MMKRVLLLALCVAVSRVHAEQPPLNQAFAKLQSGMWSDAIDELNAAYEAGKACLALYYLTYAHAQLRNTDEVIRNARETRQCRPALAPAVLADAAKLAEWAIGTRGPLVRFKYGLSAGESKNKNLAALRAQAEREEQQLIKATGADSRKVSEYSNTLDARIKSASDATGMGPEGVNQLINDTFLGTADAAVVTPPPPSVGLPR